MDGVGSGVVHDQAVLALQGFVGSAGSWSTFHDALRRMGQALLYQHLDQRVGGMRGPGAFLTACPLSVSPRLVPRGDPGVPTAGREAMAM